MTSAKGSKSGNIEKKLRTCLAMSSPPVMARLLTEAVNPQPDFKTIAEYLKMDPGLASAVMTLVNSSYYSMSQKVTDLQRAAVVLGAKELIKLVLSIAMHTALTGKTESLRQEMFGNWRMVVWSANAAELLAEVMVPQQADHAYLCALFKDLSLLLMKTCPEMNLELPAAEDYLCLKPGQLEAESEKWGITHPELTLRLLAEYEIPVEFCQGIRHHHDLDNLDAHDSLTQAVILATAWAEQEVSKEASPRRAVQFKVLLQSKLGVSKKELEKLHARCVQKFRSMLETLGIAEDDPESRFYDHSIEAQQRFYLLSLDLLDADGGLVEVARIVGRHLMWSWGVKDWELGLKAPGRNEWVLFRTKETGEIYKSYKAAAPRAIKWRFKKSCPLEHNGRVLGELRISTSDLSDRQLAQISLYVSYLKQALANYSLRHEVSELKAGSFDILPIGVARLSKEGRILETNPSFVQYAGSKEDVRGRFLWDLLREGKGLKPFDEWFEFQNRDDKKSMNRIFCSLGLDASEQSQQCIFISFHKIRGEVDEEFLVMVEDVTHIAGLQYDALRQREFLNSLVKSMHDVVLSVTGKGEITYVSPKLPQDLVGTNLFETAKPSYSYTGPWDQGFFEGEMDPVEVTLSVKDREQMHLELIFSPIASGDREMESSYLVVGRDLTQIRRLEEKVRRQAVHDGLTGLYNHFQCHHILDREVNRSRRTGREMGLVFFDLDGFKKVNDQYGHQAGDEILKEMGVLLREKLRGGVDFACRYGGDEFVIIATEISADPLQMIVERLQDSVRERFKGRIGLSIGVALLGENETEQDILRRADKASLMAKSQGGNQVVWAE